VHGLHAVVDALGLQHVQRLPDVGGRAFLAGVGDDVQAQLAAAGKHAGELLGRVAALAGVQPDADELLAKGQGLLQRLEGLALAQVAQKAQDQRAGDARSRRASSRARARPWITVSIATPRAVCVCGSKKISACATLSVAACAR
jgi:hypothetical protein